MIDGINGQESATIVVRRIELTCRLFVLSTPHLSPSPRRGCELEPQAVQPRRQRS